MTRTDSEAAAVPDAPAPVRDGSSGMVTVVGIVPAKDREDSIAATVTALLGVEGVDRVLVVDDGSSDGTAEAAAHAGAEVLRLPVNRGKGGAVLAAVDATPEADVYVLIDADLGVTAAEASRLLDPVLAGEADMTVGVLPPAGGRGGFGLVRDLAAKGIRKACGWQTSAPLSGQRAVRARFLRGLESAERFGLEVALSIDAVRAGARVLEVDVPMDHRHTGRSWSGFRHRAAQGRDILRSLWPRLTTPRMRIGLGIVLTMVVLVGMFVSAQFARVSSVPPTGTAEQVVLFGIPRLGVGDLDSGDMPTLDRLVDEGAMAAASVRTYATRPSTVESYATLSAGTRVRAGASVAEAYPADAELEGSTAAEVTERRSGIPPSGSIVLPGGPAAIDNAGTDVSSEPGALGTALADEDRSTAVVNNADERSPLGAPLVSRPAAVGAMRDDSSVATGAVGEGLVVDDPTAPFGVRTDRRAFLDAAQRATDDADFVILDPGETDRAFSYGRYTSEDQAEELRRAALRYTDELLEAVVEDLPDATLLLVVGMTPPTSSWELTPIVAYGEGVVPGHLHSQSTKRPDLVTLTDVSTTVLGALDVPVPDGMIGRELRYRSGEVSLDRLEQANDVAAGRERVYYPMALTFIIVQALFYLATIMALGLAGVAPRALDLLRLAVLTFAAWPLATFLVRMVPPLMTLGGVTHLLVWVLAALIALLAARLRSHPLAPLAAITMVTVALLLVDLSSGARLQAASVLGYSPHTAARFSGIGNTAFAVLAACAIVTAVVHVDRAPRRREAVIAAALFLGVVVVVDGGPWFGSDVGGILSLVPVFGLTIVILSGRRISARTVVIAALGTILVLGVAVGVDLLRPEGSRTHLANFVLDSRDGDTFWTTLSRKWATNQRVFGQSIWTWMVPIIAVFTVYVLVVARGWRRLLPTGSPVRAGVIGVLAAGVLGWLVNDSGIVVTALMFVYLGPFLTLLAIEARRAELVAGEPSPRIPEESLP